MTLEKFTEIINILKEESDRLTTLYQMRLEITEW